MRQGWMIGIGILIAGCAAASAQSGIIPPPNLTTPPPARQTDRPLPEAPIGHRQPRAADLPQQESNSYKDQQDNNARQDALLDSKIKGICKGC